MIVSEAIKDMAVAIGHALNVPAPPLDHGAPSLEGDDGLPLGIQAMDAANAAALFAEVSHATRDIPGPPTPFSGQRPKPTAIWRPGTWDPSDWMIAAGAPPTAGSRPRTHGF